jgi:6-phosphogluconolactonase
MEIEVLADLESVAQKAAGVIAAEARAAIAARGRFVVAISGGRDLADEDIPWTGVHIVQVADRAAARELQGDRMQAGV